MIISSFLSNLIAKGQKKFDLYFLKKHLDPKKDQGAFTLFK